MIITGLDISLTSPGVVKAELDINLDIKKISWLGFTTVKKDYKKCPELLMYNKFDNYFERTVWIRNAILNFLFKDEFGCPQQVNYATFEDYPYAGVSGQIFHIGGFTEIIKLALYEREVALRWYDIVQVKKLATTRGNADKLSMYDAYMKIPVEERIDISKLPKVETAKGKSPTSDIIDAYYLTKLLQIELKLRKGLIRLQDMTEDMIWIFNRVTQTAKENILTREFIKNHECTFD